MRLLWLLLGKLVLKSTDVAHAGTPVAAVAAAVAVAAVAAGTVSGAVAAAAAALRGTVIAAGTAAAAAAVRGTVTAAGTAAAAAGSAVAAECGLAWGGAVLKIGRCSPRNDSRKPREVGSGHLQMSR